jgi:peptide methionine sulfoxide reductase msrA/msrB
VFKGEYLTPKNRRYCINGLAIEYVDAIVKDTEEAIVAGGCFWGVQYYFNRLEGVLKTEVGYTGGQLDYPTYKQVCSSNTGHLEAMRVIYNPEQLTYEEVIKYFFEIHDPTQKNGQGPDIGSQYQSALFYFNEKQYEIADKLRHELQTKGYEVATQLLPVKVFWPAEDDHQNFYEAKRQQPYCHKWVKKW